MFLRRRPKKHTGFAATPIKYRSKPPVKKISATKQDEPIHNEPVFVIEIPRYRSVPAFDGTFIDVPIGKEETEHYVKSIKQLMKDCGAIYYYKYKELSGVLFLSIDRRSTRCYDRLYHHLQMISASVNRPIVVKTNSGQLTITPTQTEKRHGNKVSRKKNSNTSKKQSRSKKQRQLPARPKNITEIDVARF